MINADFLNVISKELKFGRVELIEKDVILNQLLIELSNDKQFSKHFAFKGGTCLIKCYLGYLRFSEDLDFTWVRQELFNGKTANEVKKEISGLLDWVIELFHKVATKIHIRFIADKKNTRYVQYGGNEKLVTLKLYYDSVILQSESFIKIQLNFTELLLYPIKMRKLPFRPIPLNDPDLEMLFPAEYNNYFKTINILTYDLREISCEKMRAILTRAGIKVRDYLDLYYIAKFQKVDLLSLRPFVIQKLRYAIKQFSKYQDNLVLKKKLLSSEGLFRWSEEKSMLLRKLDENEFGSFVKDIEDLLKSVIADLE